MWPKAHKSRQRGKRETGRRGKTEVGSGKRHETFIGQRCGTQVTHQEQELSDERPPAVEKSRRQGVLLHKFFHQSRDRVTIFLRPQTPFIDLAGHIIYTRQSQQNAENLEELMRSETIPQTTTTTTTTTSTNHHHYYHHHHQPPPLRSPWQ